MKILKCGADFEETARVTSALSDDGATDVEDISISGKWVSVTERLPQNEGEYLCYCNIFAGKYMQVYRFALNLKAIDEFDFYYMNEPGFYSYGSNGYYAISNVTYWMPLPEAPQKNN